MAVLLVAHGGPAFAQAADKAAVPARQAAAKPLHPALAKATRANAGAPAPAAAFTANDGTSQTLAAYRGKPVLVNLWATWCAPCIAEMPALDRLMGRSQGKLVVLPISQDLGGWRAVDKFAPPQKFKNLPLRLDKENAWALAMKAKGLPLTILYDAQGREVWRLAGPAEWDQIPVNALLP